MTLRRPSPQAFPVLPLVCATAALALGAVEACGAGSSLDDYSDGVPEIIPEPITEVPDSGGRDAGNDAGRDAASAGGAAGGS